VGSGFLDIYRKALKINKQSSTPTRALPYVGANACHKVFAPLMNAIFFRQKRHPERSAPMDNRDFPNPPRAPWREAWNEIVFGRETFAGRLFDSILLILILLSVLAVLLESVPSIREKYGMFLRISIWIFTGLFTAEYVTRLVTATSAKRYARSFFGIVDFLAIGPVYLGFLFGGGTIVQRSSFAATPANFPDP
jgi:Ion transport protein